MMKQFFTILIGIGLLCSNSLFATTFLIQKGGSGDPTWSVPSQAVAGRTLIDLTVLATPLETWYNGVTFVAGDSVFIINGTYALSAALAIDKKESLFGGFSGTEVTIEERAKGAKAWIFTSPTILDAQGIKNVFTSFEGATVPCILDGLTLTRGFTTAANNAYAVGILGLTTTVRNCIISNSTIDNNAVQSGRSCSGFGVVGAALIKDCYFTGMTRQYIIASNNAGLIIDGCTFENNNAGAIKTVNGSGDAIKVKNCTFKNNTYDGAYLPAGTTSGTGAIQLFSNAAHTSAFTVDNCVFEGNTSPTTGDAAGAIMMNFTNATPQVANITNCTFKGNSSGTAGAVYSKQGVHTISNCVFENNTGAPALKVVTGTASSITVNNTIFKGNTVSDAVDGAAISTIKTFTGNNLVIYGNKGKSAVGVTGAVGVVSNFNNCTFAANTLADGTTFTPIYTGGNPAPTTTFTNCLAYECTAQPLGAQAITANYCGFEAGTDIAAYLGATGNIQTVDATTFYNAAANDYSLKAGSVAVDAGTVITECNPDIAGNARPAGPSFDMGAYEFPNYNVWTKVEKTIIKDVIKVNRVSANTIAVFAPKGSDIKIYTILGSAVYSAKSTSGSFEVNAMPHGVYLIESTVAGSRTVKKISL